MAVSFGIEFHDGFMDGAVEAIRAGEGLVSEMMPLEVAPENLDVVQLRSIFRQPLDREPVGALGEGRTRHLAGVDRAVVEDEHDRRDRNPERGPIANFRRRPARSTAFPSWRPFRVWRGRRHAIIGALIAGECDPDALLRLVQRGVKAPPEKLRAALTGRITERHRFLLRLHMRQIDALAAAIAEIDQEVDRDLDPFRQAVRLLRTIPGVSDLTAQVIVSEIGIDMSRFPTAGHLVSWAGLCPRNDESAGKRRSPRLRKGAPWLKTTLVQCAWAGTRKKGSDLQAQFQRLRHRRGPKKAVCAVAASILTAAYHMLRDGTFYQDLGPDHLRRATPETQASRLARQITKLGFTCTLAPANKLVSV